MLADLGFNEEVPYPDIDTKADAQRFVGLDMEELEAEKEVFKETIIPEWLEKAKEREANMPVKRVSEN